MSTSSYGQPSSSSMEMDQTTNAETSNKANTLIDTPLNVFNSFPNGRYSVASKTKRSTDKNSPNTNITKRSKPLVAPIIYFKLDDKFLNNKREIQNEFFSHYNQDELNINHFKVTANGNLLVYPETDKDKKLLVNDRMIFPNLRKLDLEIQEDKIYTLILRGASVDDLIEYRSDLEEQGVVNIHGIKNKDGKIIKISKIDVESFEVYNQLLNKKYIKVGYFRFKIEEVAKPPLRCSKCKKFGHMRKDCNNPEVCGKCSSLDHSDDNCPQRYSRERSELKCANCNKNHSSFYKGCEEYKINYKKMIENVKLSDTNTHKNLSKHSTVPQGFYRNYSSATTANSEDKILNKLNEIDCQIKKTNDNQVELSNKIDSYNVAVNQLSILVDKLTKKVEEFNIKLSANNYKILYMFIDLQKIFNPGFKPNAETAIIINNTFIKHELGSGLNINDLNKYIDRLWKS